MSAAESGSTAWRWRTVSSQPPQLAGGSVATAISGGRLHVLASRPEGGAVSHSRLDGMSLRTCPEVPLRSVTGAIGVSSDDALLVCGAHADGDAPVVCHLDPSGEVANILRLPRSSPVAAWPRLVATEATGKRYVVWATGELLDAQVWLADVSGERLAEPVNVLDRVGTLGFYATAAGNAVHVLCYGDALDFARWRADQPALKRRLQTPRDSAATLLGGAVVWPTASHTFAVWDVQKDERRGLELHEPPERASAPARHLRLLRVPEQGDLLYWETHLPDDFPRRLDDDSVRMVHGVSVRAWLAKLDRAHWRVTEAVEVPASESPPFLAWLDGRVALVRAVSGVIEVALGEDVSDSG